MAQRPNLDGMSTKEYSLLMEALEELLVTTRERLERLYGADHPKAGRVEYFEDKAQRIERMIERVGNDAEDRP
jgi:hypothetical protein